MVFTVQLFSQPFWPNVLSLAFTAWKSGRQKRVGIPGLGDRALAAVQEEVW